MSNKHTFPLFSAAIFFLELTRSVISLSVELASKIRLSDEQQRFDIHEDEDDDDALLLHLLSPVFFFFETVEANWTRRREKKELFEIFNIIVVVFITIVGRKSG